MDFRSSSRIRIHSMRYERGNHILASLQKKTPRTCIKKLSPAEHTVVTFLIGRTCPDCRAGRSAVSHHISASLGCETCWGSHSVATSVWPCRGQASLGTQLSPVVAPGFPHAWPRAILTHHPYRMDFLVCFMDVMVPAEPRGCLQGRGPGRVAWGGSDRWEGPFALAGDAASFP